MERVMTTDFRHTWLFPSQSPCLDPNNKVPWWERCVKRKYNDGSGKLLQGYNMAKTEASHEKLRLPPWGTMPSITHCHKTSITSTRRSSISSLQDKQGDKGRNPPLSVSNVGVFPHTIIVENETSYPLASADHPLQPPYIQNDKKDAVSKKRIHVAMSVETLHGAAQAGDKATENEVLRLKEALKFERRALRKLYRDLEEERCASTTAANEVMAMIRRLQEEKAAALVESHQYKRASEEREAYNQEAITLLKEALSNKEHELLSLQDHIENYRDGLRKMKSGQGLIQMIESNHLGGDKENAQLLILEGKETASCLLVESKYLKEDLDEDCDVGGRASGESMYLCHYPLEESFLEGQICQEIEIENMGFANLQCENNRSDTVIEEQEFEDVSMSFLARVACLEERFACLGENQALDSESFDLVPHNMSEDISFLGCGKQDPASMPLDNTELNCWNSAKLKTGFVADNCEDLEDLKCPVFERATTYSEYGNQEHAPIEETGLKLNDITVVAKDLRHLRVRLQALEGERAFMKEAIEALRKENMELKLLQEIANQLQELKGSGCRNQLPFLSFFKGILLFAGIQSLACTEKRRFFFRCQGSLQISPNKQEHGGLLHLLNNPLREEKRVCVTRERKVKLGNT